MSKKKARKFANEIVQKWKGFDVDQTDDNKLSLAQADKFIDSGKKFEKAWRKFDNSKQQTGMLDLMEAHSFIKNIIPKAEAHTEMHT